MNYIKEIKAFNDYLLINNLSTGEIALWYALMATNNKTKWLKEFTVSNLVVQQLTSLSRSGLDSARNKLKQRGLIDYKPGRSNQAGKYRLNSLVCIISDTAEDTVEDTVEDKYRTQQRTDTGHGSGTLYKHKHKQKLNKERKKEKKDSTYEKIIDNFTKDEKVKEAIWGYIQMRIAKKAKPTDRALGLALKELNAISTGDPVIQIAILNQSVLNNWTGIFPLREIKGGINSAADKHDGIQDSKYSSLDKSKWLKGTP